MSVTIRHNGNEIVGFDQFNVYGQEAVDDTDLPLPYEETVKRLSNQCLYLIYG